MCLCWQPLSLSLSLSLYFVCYFLMLNYLFIWKLFCRKRARILFRSFFAACLPMQDLKNVLFLFEIMLLYLFFCCCCVWVCCCGGHFAKMFIRAGMRHLSKSNPKHKSQLQCSRSQLGVARKPSSTFGDMPNKAQKCVSLHRNDRGGCVSRFRFPCT